MTFERRDVVEVKYETDHIYEIPALGNDAAFVWTRHRKAINADYMCLLESDHFRSRGRPPLP